jgi:hypothetical protein
MKGHYPLYLWLGVTDAEGRIVASSDASDVGMEYEKRDWFRAVRESRASHVGNVEPYEAAGGVDSVAFTAPIIGSQGEFLCVVSTRVGLPAIEEQVTKTVRMFERREGFIGTIEYQFMLSDGTVFLDSDLEHKGYVNLKRMGLPSALVSERDPLGYVEEQHLRRHVPVVTGYARAGTGGPLEGLRWTVLLRVDRRDIVAPI